MTIIAVKIHARRTNPINGIFRLKKRDF